MSKTKLEVVTMALRRIRVLAGGEDANGDDFGDVGDTLDALFEELKDVHGMAFTWDLGAVPDNAFLPLSYLLAVEVAPMFNRPTETRNTAMMRLNAVAFPNDVDDRRDTDDDGTVSTDEATAGLAAAYF